MANLPAPLPDSDLIGVAQTTRLLIPLFSAQVQAGFPSPAENYIEQVLDLNGLCIDNAEATYFVRVRGDSMSGDELAEGDIMVVDGSHELFEGKIVVVWLNGDYTVKRFHQSGDLLVLMPSNPAYPPIYVGPDDDFRVFGVVTYWIKKARTKKVFGPC